jgi:hypothetical protein
MRPRVSPSGLRGVLVVVPPSRLSVGFLRSPEGLTLDLLGLDQFNQVGVGPLSPS